MLLHKSLKANIKPACSISYVIVESDGVERHQRGMMTVQTSKREFRNNAEPEGLPDAWRMTKVKGGQTMNARV